MTASISTRNGKPAYLEAPPRLRASQIERPVELIISSSRYGEITAARFALYKALRLRGWSYPRIGKFVGRDHASIIHGARKAEYKMERSSIYAEKVNALASWQPEALHLPAERRVI